jgi:hypothetical protein
MRKMHDYLLNLLKANNHARLTQIIGFGQLDIVPSGYIGTARNADLLVTIRGSPYSGRQKVAVEVESDPGFDVDKTVQKMTKDQPYPTVVIIPKEHEKDAWRFQDNLIKVWLWNAKFRWKCDLCKNTFTTFTTAHPKKCEKCQRGGNINFDDFECGEKPFIESSKNPAMNWAEIQGKLKHIGAWHFG